MSIKRGLPDNLDLGNMLLNKPALDSDTAPTASTPSESPAPSETAPKSIPARKSRLEAQYTRKQRGLSISEPVMLRLKLESLRSGRTQSEVAEEILCKYLPNLKIAG